MVGLVVVLVGLVVLDRALSYSSTLGQRGDAQAIAIRLEDALESERWMLAAQALASRGGDTTVEMPLILGLADSGAHVIRRVWLADSAGRVLRERRTTRSAGARDGQNTLAAFPLDSLATAAHGSGRAATSRVGRLPSGERGFIMIAPVQEAGRGGYVGGEMSADSLL